MTENQMKHKLYDFYQLDWMMSHGYSLADLMHGMTEIPCYHAGLYSGTPGCGPRR